MNDIRSISISGRIKNNQNKLVNGYMVHPGVRGGYSGGLVNVQ